MVTDQCDIMLAINSDYPEFLGVRREYQIIRLVQIRECHIRTTRDIPFPITNIYRIIKHLSDGQKRDVFTRVFVVFVMFRRFCSEFSGTSNSLLLAGILTLLLATILQVLTTLSAGQRKF